MIPAPCRWCAGLPPCWIGSKRISGGRCASPGLAHDHVHARGSAVGPGCGRPPGLQWNFDAAGRTATAHAWWPAHAICRGASDRRAGEAGKRGDRVRGEAGAVRPAGGRDRASLHLRRGPTGGGGRGGAGRHLPRGGCCNAGCGFGCGRTAAAGADPCSRCHTRPGDAVPLFRTDLQRPSHPLRCRVCDRAGGLSRRDREWWADPVVAARNGQTGRRTRVHPTQCPQSPPVDLRPASPAVSGAGQRWLDALAEDDQGRMALEANAA